MSRDLNGNWRRGAATPNRVARLVVPEPTYPAVFAVKPILAPAAFTTFPRPKITRPGVVLLAGGDNREGDPVSYPVEFQLHRLARPVPRRIRRLVMKADPDGAAHFVLRDVAGERASDFPMLDRAPWDDSSPFFTEVDAGLRLNRAPDTGRPIRLRIVAHGLPGWQRGNRRVPPPAPTPYHAGLTLAERGRGSIYDNRHPLEIWLFLSQEDRDRARQAHDSALFTVAPFIIGGEIDPAEVLFAVYLPDTVREIGNFGTAYELAASADAAGIHCVHFGNANEDVFAQDAVMLGYSVDHIGAEDAVVLTNRRKQTRLNLRDGLEAQAGVYAANDRTIIFPDIYDDLSNRNSMDYGGNLLVSPPVARGTNAVDEGDAGPAVPAHPAAPYGKIIVGDSGDSDVGRPTGDFRAFLRAQRVQPIVPIDTAWLHVKHADEIVTFVRAPNRQNTNNGASGFCMLFASPHLAVQLMLKAERIRFLTPARWKVDLGRDYTVNKRRFGTPLDANAHAWINKLAAIESRLLYTLRLRRQGDLIRVPVLFTPGDNDAAARMPNMVNLISLGDTVIVPKPFGPRVPPDAAAGILKSLPGQGITQAQIDGTNMLSLLNDSHWANTTRAETWRDFYRPIRNEVRVLQQGGALSGDQYTWPAGVGQVPNDWEKWTFNPTRIDLFQAYMYVQLRALGLNVRFVDDWYWYHQNEGELHCGSKVRHTPPAIGDGSRWWQNWPALLAYGDAI